MYLLYAPPEKFGLLPTGHPLLHDEIKFYQNVALCTKFYWRKVHCINGCRDITPKFFHKLRAKRKLQSILIIATGGIGDSLWSNPFIRSLRERFPASFIAVLTEKKNFPAWKHNPYINEMVENCYWNLFGLFRVCDEIYDFGGIATVLKKFKKLDPVEAIFQYAETPLPKDKNKLRPHLIVTIDEGNRSKKNLLDKGIDLDHDKLIVIGLHASTTNRDWPFSYTKQITANFIQSGYKVVWAGSDSKYSDDFLDEETKNLGQLNLVCKTSLRDIMAVISLSDLFIGPNSALMVIATSFLIPTIGLFGAFNPKLRAKYYDRFSPLYGKVPCAPCNEHWTECREGHPSPCMKVITPNHVIELSQKMLSKYPRSLMEKMPIE
jgi:ADP-heptose:LPS heptosyltransferase